MNADEFRQRQAPLKEKYKTDSSAAMVTLIAEARAGEGVSCRVSTARGLVVAGLHPATGGDGSQACSGDMLLDALVGCAGVTLKAVATAMGIELADARVVAEGDLDFRGTLGVSKDAPVGFKDIRLRFLLKTAADDEIIAKLVSLTERYCVVLQTLKNSPTITATHERLPG